MPISGPPIQNGWIAIETDRIRAIGQSHQSCPCSQGTPIDLGDVAILPALVNAHTHLEFSLLAQRVGHSGIKLPDWIVEVVRTRRAAGNTLNQAFAAIQAGMQFSHSAGIGLIGDIATTPVPALENIERRSCDVILMAEVLGLTTSRSDTKLADAIEHLSRFANDYTFRPGISPHAPYSTPLNVVRQCVTIAIDNRLPLAMHVAESAEERQLIEHGDGPFADKLKEIQFYSPTIFPWGNDATLNLLKLLVRAPRTLIVHGNDLRKDEIEFIAKFPHVTVIYCPRTHAYFDHPSHPVAKLLAAGVRVALGTDSLASSPDLSVWNEVQWLLRHRQDIRWQAVLEMATINGAESFARADLGRIEVGSNAKLLTIATTAKTVSELPESFLLNSPKWLRV